MRAGAPACVPNADTIDLDELVGGPGAALLGRLRAGNDIASNECLDIRIRYLGSGQHPEQRFHRKGLAGSGDLAAQRPRVGGLHVPGDLVGLHFEDRLADANRAPSSTSHALTVPSFIARPHLGMTMGVMPPSVLGAFHGAANGLGNLLRAGT